jgi:uncharacterized protein (DUF1800 family)
MYDIVIGGNQERVMWKSLIGAVALSSAVFVQAAENNWANDLSPISAQDWNAERAAHLLERAGFGATPEDIKRFAAMSPDEAMRVIVKFEGSDNSHLAPFDESGVFDPGVDHFPESRPATTTQAKQNGEALGVKVKPAGNRKMQPVVNKFFYWLRASRLETDRLAYWWANRMLTTQRPLEEKMALFWHGHFANNEEKVRDYRKMQRQLALFHSKGTGNFRELLIGAAQDPAMLAFLDAGVNVKGAPNENFAREIMELFTMGVGNYSEKDIREAARAFTGWNYEGVNFIKLDEKHDDGVKNVLGKSGNFDGVQVIDIILQQPVTAEFVAGKIYRYMVRQEISDTTKKQLAAVLRDNNYELAPLLETIFLSKDFYSAPSMATRIKSPVELAVSTYKKLGLKEVPGVPDFNDATEALGQRLFRPPTVAGWAQGKSWITPGLLLERGNFARDMLFPNINFLPPDRYPEDETIRIVSAKIDQGLDITTATKPEGKGMGGGGEAMMSMANSMADRDEDFNTRYASFRGWQMATEKVKPILRRTAQLDLAGMVKAQKLASTTQVVDYMLARFLRTPADSADRTRFIEFLNTELGTDKVSDAETYLEEPLRLLLHLIMSLPEYQLG